MCILFIAVKQHSEYPLIIAANRDEFHARPTQESHWWTANRNVLAGKDLKCGGSWMGINKRGNIAALTNVRAPSRDNPDAITRGELVVNYLEKNPQKKDWQNQLISTRNAYNGYNLLFGEPDNLSVYNNHSNEFNKLGVGVYGLSNASLNSPWPKTTQGMTDLTTYCRTSALFSEEHLFNILRNDSKASDEELPSTGIPYDWEKALSSIFIQTKEYGTRSSTLVYVDQKGLMTWSERQFDANAKLIGHQRFEFQV